MASKPLRPCRHCGCCEVTREGWCAKHKPKHQRKDSADYHGWYLLPVWKERLRLEQLLREPFCRECVRKGIRTKAAVVDHIKPFRGDWELFVDAANHQSLCKHHHDQKTAREQCDERRKMH